MFLAHLMLFEFLRFVHRIAFQLKYLYGKSSKNFISMMSRTIFFLLEIPYTS